MEGKVAEHHGRIGKTAGDGMLMNPERRPVCYSSEAGFAPIAVILTIDTEIGLITPPVGLNI